MFAGLLYLACMLSTSKKEGVGSCHMPCSHPGDFVFRELWSLSVDEQIVINGNTAKNACFQRAKNSRHDLSATFLGTWYKVRPRLFPIIPSKECNQVFSVLSYGKYRFPSGTQIRKPKFLPIKPKRGPGTLKPTIKPSHDPREFERVYSSFPHSPETVSKTGRANWVPHSYPTSEISTTSTPTLKERTNIKSILHSLGKPQIPETHFKPETRNISSKTENPTIQFP